MSELFDPDDPTTVKYKKVGAWDYYEDISKRTQVKIPIALSLKAVLGKLDALPYFWRMLNELATIPGCLSHLLFFLAMKCILSLLPALTLWYSGQLLKIVEAAVEKRTFERDILLRVTIGRCLVPALNTFLHPVAWHYQKALNLRITRYYNVQTFRSMAGLDLPTFDDHIVQALLRGGPTSSGSSALVWSVITDSMDIFSRLTSFITCSTVLVNVLQNQRDWKLLTAVALSRLALDWLSLPSRFLYTGVWAATTDDRDFLGSEGLQTAVNSVRYRKEIVSGQLGEYLWMQYKSRMDSLGDKITDIWDVHHHSDRWWNWFEFLKDPLDALPQVLLCLWSVRNPSTIPMSLASLQLITSTVGSFNSSLWQAGQSTAVVANSLEAVRELYDHSVITNKIVDGDVPFPESQSDISEGISIEFQNVSFKYPGSDILALNKVSFKVEQGQLCVIVGDNGSGKSTILKLISRLYDPAEGRILINGLDIRTIRLADLRRATSVLFQDFALFPMTLAENIGYGDVHHAHDMERVREAARLGGAEEFIDQLPRGFHSYLDRPVSNWFFPSPRGDSKFAGKTIDFSKLTQRGGGGSEGRKELSGGELQRIALSRTYMRSLVSSDSNVGLLLFDEPSASLDPTAEYDLFERLRNLRGSKTMVFSSHRFGNLTRHANIILYISKAVVIESGSHEQLLKKGGDYARIWNLQAQAFL